MASVLPRTHNYALMAGAVDLGAVFDASPNPYMVVDRDLHYVAVNRAYLAVTSRRRDELIGRKLTDVFPHDPANPYNENRRLLEASLRRVLDSGQPDALPFIHYRILVPRGSGAAYEDRYWSATHTPLPAPDGQVQFVLQHTVDVTSMYRRTGPASFAVPDAQVQAGVLGRAQLVQQRADLLDQDLQRLLRAQTEVMQLARVLDATRDFVGIADLQGRPMFVNQAGLELMGLADLDAARVLSVVEYCVPAQRERVAAEVLPAALRDGYWEGELLFLHTRTGEQIPVMCSVFPLRDGAGAISALATITRDLRAQKAAEAERTRLLQNEREARAQAEQANELKDQFLAVVSHELRTPLTAILGWMQMLKSGTLPPEKRQRALDAIERNARIQAQLIEDLLDVSRIMSDKLQLDREPVEVAAVVGAALETVRPVAESKGVTLSSSIDFSGRVLGDTRRLQQVVWNLLSNAVKFTPAGGSVLLTVERYGQGKDQAVEIAVIDTGRGISPAFLPYVFERFRQAHNGASQTTGGLGLGLSIVRHVVQAHGGTVTAQSPGEGKGATFVVRLPLAPMNEKVAALPQQDGESFARPDLEGTKLLVVEDEEDTREYMKALLQQCGAAVTVADSVAQAMQALGHDRPDVILSDIGMPGEDGYALIQRIRRLPEEQGGRTPAVALTAHARKEDRTRAMMAGFQNHLTKPVAADELLAVVASLAAPPKR